MQKKGKTKMISARKESSLQNSHNGFAHVSGYNPDNIIDLTLSRVLFICQNSTVLLLKKELTFSLI